MKYVVYTDGACSGNPGPGGWGAIIIDDKENQIIISGKEKVIVSQDECIVNMPMVNNKNGKFLQQGEIVSVSKEKFL